MHVAGTTEEPIITADLGGAGAVVGKTTKSIVGLGKKK